MAKNEMDLVNESRSGSEPAFLELYYRHRDPVFRFAYRLTVSAPAAEDITQECFLTLLKGSRIKVISLRAYLFGIVRHLAARHIRQIGRANTLRTDIVSLHDLSGNLMLQERARLVEEAVHTLPLLQREAIILFEYEELSLKEIADVAECSVGVIKARLHRARESLRQKLAPLLDLCRERRCS
jgi:RNA polymerase sigma-70 factor, ECF subfamily